MINFNPYAGQTYITRKGTRVGIDGVRYDNDSDYPWRIRFLGSEDYFSYTRCGNWVGDMSKYRHDEDLVELIVEEEATKPENNDLGMKFDDGKTRFDYVPPAALEQLAEVLTFGANKYAAHSWRTVPNGQERYLAALLRHVNAYRQGERCDPETGLPHMAHIMCNAAFLLELDMDLDKEDSAE